MGELSPVALYSELNENMDYNFKILFIILMSCPAILFGQNEDDLCINEFMQSNIDDLFVDYEYPDSWVELYNPTHYDINIKGYVIGSSKEKDKGYKIPVDTVCKRGGYILIYCDKEDVNLHADFCLEAGKGEIFLFDSLGKVVDHVDYQKMPAANIARGRVRDGDDSWHYELNSTPGSKNEGGGASYVLPDPVFSLNGGKMDSPTMISVCMPRGDYPDDTKLYITLNGDEPIKSSVCGSEFTINVDKTTVVRAKLLSDNALPQRSVTQSYIFHPRVTKLPIVSIVTDSIHLYDNTNGLFSKDTVADNKPNYMQDWRRPINIEYFPEENKGSLFNQVCEAGIQGGYSRKYNQKSLKFYAKKRFGTKRFFANFWTDKPFVAECKSFTIRNGGQYSDRSRINDAFIQRIFGTHFDNFDWQAYTPTIAYINGEYKGVYGLRERSNEDYVEANYDGLEDIYITDEVAYLYPNHSKVPKDWKNFYYNILAKEKTSFRKISEYIDIDNFVKHTIAECYSNNLDYPNHNIRIWKPADDSGKWRWILKDVDLFGSYSPSNYKMLDFLFIDGDPNSEPYKFAIRTEAIERSHFIYKTLHTFPEFRELFIDLYTVCLGDFLKPTYMLNELQKMVDEIYEEIEPTFDSNDHMSILSNFTSNIDIIKRFITNRPYYVYHDLAEKYELGKVIPIKILINDNKAVRMNGICLQEGNYDGYYYSNRRLLVDTGDSNLGCTITIYGKGGEIIKVNKSEAQIIDITLNQYPDCQEAIFEITDMSSGIANNVKDNNCSIRAKYYNLNGVLINELKKGLNIIRYPNGKFEKKMK